MSNSVSLPIDSIKLLDDPVALAVWVFILSNGSSYPIKGELIQKRFGIGRDKVTATFKKIKNAGLMRDHVIRSENGKFSGKSLICSITPEK